MNPQDSNSEGEPRLPLSPLKEKRSSGLWLIYTLIAISMITPVITIYMNKVNPPKFETVEAYVADDMLVQVTWMTHPRHELQHVVIFPKRPPADEENITTGFDVIPPPGLLGFFIRPRVIYHNGVELTWHVKKRLRNKKLKYWILDTFEDDMGEYGVAFPRNPPPELYDQWKSGKDLVNTDLWKLYLEPKISQFRQQRKDDLLDISRPVNTSKMY